MLEIIAILFFVTFTLIMGLLAKKDVYVHEHESVIKKELEVFETTMKIVRDLKDTNDYKIDSTHLY